MVARKQPRPKITPQEILDKPAWDWTPAEAAYLLYCVKRAKNDFAYFCMLCYNGYQFPRHIQSLHKVLTTIEGTPDARYMVTIPPRYGKSLTVSQLFPAWYLGRNPNKNIITASYTAGLTGRFAANTKAIMQSHAYSLIFPHIQIQGRARAAWGIKGYRGGLFATGVTSSITGFGADCLLIDDPIRDAMYADSLSWRENIWEWYTNTAYTRLHPGAPVFVISCMTGDTPVLLADGSERPLREIQVGDRVATYDDGELGTSTILNHINQGCDAIYKITTASGKVVRANARHPFLVQDQGELKWVRLKHLTTHQKIVGLREPGASGRERLAALKDVVKPLSVGDIATSITSARNGQTDTDLHLSIQSPDATIISNIVTELPVLSMIPCWQNRVEGALFAGSFQRAIADIQNSVLTIAMKQAGLEGYCATNVILPLDTFSPNPTPCQWWNTFDFTADQILSIESDGFEDVFDIEVARTGNFIANGLVSHNTRWHHDDLSGRLKLQNAEPDADTWTEVYYPALLPDGKPLWPERYNLQALQRIKASVGTRTWNALYQGNPTPEEGSAFKRWMFRKIISRIPGNVKINWVRYWDKAGTDGGGDYTVGVLMGRDKEGRFYIHDIVRGQWGALEREQIIHATAELDRALYGRVRIAVEQEPGSGGLESYQATARRLAGFRVMADRPSGTLGLRADPLITQLEAGNMYFMRGDWMEPLIEEATQFPLGKHDDQIAAMAGGFKMLTSKIPFQYATV